MKSKVITGIMLTLLLIGMLTSVSKVQPAKAEPVVCVFPINISDLIFYVIVESNSSVSYFYFNWSNEEIRFDVTGSNSTIGFCNVTIPKDLLRGEPWLVLFDENSILFTENENATHTMLFFTYTHSTRSIRIVGTEVIRPPAVSFTYSPSNPDVNQTVTLNASKSYDPEGYIVSYNWDFGDGNKTNTTDPIITHKYIAEGTYNVSLTVTDNVGLGSPRMIIPVMVIPEFSSFIILPLFMIATLLIVIVYRRKHSM